VEQTVSDPKDPQDPKDNSQGESSPGTGAPSAVDATARDASSAHSDDAEGGPRAFSAVEWGEKLFQWRDFTPVALVLLLLLLNEASVFSATLGVVLIAFGEIFRIYAVSFIGGVSRTRSSSTGQRLITDGPFGWVRNPLYVGNFFITLGLAVFGGVTWFVILVIALFAFQYYCIVRYEEKLLTKKFGEEYQHYLDTVPAWIPIRVPPLADWQWPETFSPALKSEKRTLMAIGVILLALVASSPRGRTASGVVALDRDMTPAERVASGADSESTPASP